MNGQKEKTVPCEQCGKLFASAERVKIHVRVTHGQKACACEICGSGFSYRCKLLDHMRTHTGDKPFTCESCGRSFSQRYHLRRHQMIHSGERPFPCEVCGRGFYRKDKLSRHRRVHSNPGGSRGNRSTTVNPIVNCISSPMVTSIGQQIHFPNSGASSIQIFPVQMDANLAARLQQQTTLSTMALKNLPSTTDAESSLISPSSAKK